MKDGKSALFIVADGGPDYNTNHATNWFFYGRFFRDMNLDALVVTSFCPGDSAMNPIEHLWGPCTRRLTGVSLPSTLPGETRRPSQQALPPDVRVQQEHTVFNAAMTQIQRSYWNNFSYADRPVSVIVEESGAAPHPYGADYDEVKKVVTGSARQLRRSNLDTEYQFVTKHMDKRLGTLIFSKCAGQTCRHCSEHPAQLAEKDMATFRSFPTPTPSTSHEGHYKSFIESLRDAPSPPCAYMPTFIEKHLGRCSEEACQYVFGSQKDRDDHRRKCLHR